MSSLDFRVERAVELEMHPKERVERAVELEIHPKERVERAEETEKISKLKVLLPKYY
jgi:hypothetical protein